MSENPHAERRQLVSMSFGSDDFRIVRDPGNRRPILIRADCFHGEGLCPYAVTGPDNGGQPLRGVPWVMASERVLKAMALDLLTDIERQQHGGNESDTV